MKAALLEQRIPPVAGRFWLLGALALVVAPHLWRMPAWVGIGCVAVIGWRWLREVKGWELPGWPLRALLTLLGIAAVVLTYRSLLGREAGVALLTIMLCLKLVELRTVRDAMVVVFLGYFLVVSAFLFSQSIFVGSYMFLVVVALTTALIALNHPAASLSESRGYLRTAGGLLLQALPMMLVLFVLFPRIPGPLWSLPNDAHSARTGLSEQMDLGAITELADSEEVAFRVQFEGAVPNADQLYWRGPVLWFTDGRLWQAMEPGDRRTAALGVPTYHAEGSPVRYTVTLEPHNRRWLFALDLPAETPSGGRVRGDFQLLAETRITELHRYDMASHLRYRMEALDPDQRFLGLLLPEEVNPRSRHLARQWQAVGLSDAALVEHALALFRDEPFWYTRRPPPLEGTDPVDQFLFDTRRGFCEHYAAAFVTLMRAADVPARVVTGYQGGEHNAVGGYLVVRQSDAHAWAEVWLAGRGWVRVDPTSVIPPSRVETLQDSTRFRSTDPLPVRDGDLAWLARQWRTVKGGWDAVNHTWNQWVLGFDQAKQHELLRRFGLEPDWGRMALGLAGALAVLLTAVAFYLLRQEREPVDPAARLYGRFCDRLARRGLKRGPAEGPVDFASRVATLRPDLAAQVARVTALYTRLRYHREADDHTLRSLRIAVRDLRP